MYIEKKNFNWNILLMNQNSAPDQKIRPDDLIREFNIGKDTYYDDLKYLGIKAERDSESKPYLTFEQAEQVRALRSHVSKTGKREGFSNSALTVLNDNNLATSTNSNSVENTEDIYIEPTEPTEQFDFNQLLRKAEEVKTRRLATPDLIVQELANRMSEDDLSDDLKQKLSAVRETVNPKWTPASLAETILAQHRQSRSGN